MSRTPRRRPASRSSDAPAASSYAHPLGRAMAELLQPLLGGPRAADRRACWSPLLLACAKKTDRPPGAPEIRPATPAEVLLAQEVYDERLVA